MPSQSSSPSPEKGRDPIEQHLIDRNRADAIARAVEPEKRPLTPAAMTERLIQAAVDYEKTMGRSLIARRDLNEARAAVEAALAQRDGLLAALEPFAEPHFFGDDYVRFAPRLILAARAAIARATEA